MRCIFIESQPLQRQALDWRIVDAKDGRLAEGALRIEALRRHQPWSVADSGAP